MLDAMVLQVIALRLRREMEQEYPVERKCVILWSNSLSSFVGSIMK